MTINCVAYYRVSTDKQGLTGLGMDAQKAAVSAYIGGVWGRGGDRKLGPINLVSEYVEVESGRNKDRPQLLAAIAECRRLGAVLLIARLDRLARNVAFISNLMEGGIEFIAVDMPSANRLTIHILAAVAEHEREMISQRTKAALAIAKENGIRLGNPRAAEAAVIARAAKLSRARGIPVEVMRLIREWRGLGKGLRAIARELNALNIRAPLGGVWYAATVSKQLERC